VFKRGMVAGVGGHGPRRLETIPRVSGGIVSRGVSGPVLSSGRGKAQRYTREQNPRSLARGERKAKGGWWREAITTRWYGRAHSEVRRGRRVGGD
jgi:hypothetical protein